jgi:hypothetical protein
MTRRQSKSSLLLAVLAVGSLTVAGPARAVDSAALSSSPTYYEEVAGSVPPEQFNSTAQGLPTALGMTDSTARVEYSVLSEESSQREWKISIRDLFRKHERIDAVYQMVLILPLPEDGEGRDAFRTVEFGLTPREGAESASVPLIYGGEKIVLKRNRSLERALLPGLVEPGGGPGKLPALDGTGYGYRAWDTIVRYDPGYGDTVQLFLDVRYSTATDVAAPDPADDRLKAYVVTWIPSLDPSVPPFALRMDVSDPQ